MDVSANSQFPEDPLDEVNGTRNSPRYFGNLDAHLDVNNWRFYCGLDWTVSMSSYDHSGEDPATSTVKLSVPNYCRHTRSGSPDLACWPMRLVPAQTMGRAR